MEGRRVVPLAYYWIYVLGVRMLLQENPGSTSPSTGEIRSLRRSKIRGSTLPRKFSKHNHNKTVPQTNTGGRVEKTKVNE